MIPTLSHQSSVVSKNTLIFYVVAAVLVMNFSSGCGDDSNGSDPNNNNPTCNHPKVEQNCKADAEGITWCAIPPGCFMMGSPESKSCPGTLEKQHNVTLTTRFEIMSTEVTQGHFNKLMGYNPSYSSTCNHCPVDWLSSYEAAAYANEMSSRAGKAKCYSCTGKGQKVTCDVASTYSDTAIYKCPGYRLPTEAEWEYAYRAGTRTAFYNGPITNCSGDDPNLDKIGWYDQNSGWKAQPVGRKEPNQWGLYDMAGNVQEWCHDWYNLHSNESATNPVGTSESEQYRIVRGGSLRLQAYRARAARRDNFKTDSHGPGLGFRLVRSLEL